MLWACRRVVLPNGLTALLISDPEMADAVGAADGEGADASNANHSDDDSGSEEVRSGANVALLLCAACISRCFWSAADPRACMLSLEGAEQMHFDAVNMPQDCRFLRTASERCAQRFPAASDMQHLRASRVCRKRMTAAAMAAAVTTPASARRARAAATWTRATSRSAPPKR